MINESASHKIKSQSAAARILALPLGLGGLIETKLAPPSQATPWINRCHILKPLVEAEHHKIVVVTAPAGYGKTVLISQYYQFLAEQGRPIGWLSIDQNDADPAAMLACLVQAISRGLGPDIAEDATLALRQLGLNAEAGLAAVISAIAKLEHRFVLFLDDFDLCQDAATIRILATFISRAPANLAFVIAAREPPRLSLRRLAAEGKVEVISWPSLLFNVTEVSEMFASNSGFPLSTDQAHRMLDVTEGWAMGLQLARLAVDHNDNPEDVIASFSGRHGAVSDYLTEDVLALKDQPTIDFLLQTAVLERFNADLCNSVLDIVDAQKIIAGLERSNTFIFSLDAEGRWYRYHHLFQAFLRKQLDPRDAERLQKSASRWSRENGEYKDAVHLAVATKDNDFLAETLSEVCEGLVETGQHRLLRAMVARLPLAIMTRYPRLALHMVWSDDMLGNLQEAQHLLDVIEHAYSKDANLANGYPSHTSIEDDILHKRMMIALSKGDMRIVLELCDRLLNTKGFSDPYLVASVHASQISARYHMFDCSGITGRAEQIIGRLPERGVLNGSIWTNCIIGLAHERRGETAKAKASYSEALALAKSLEHSPHLAGMAAAFLAQIHYEENDVTQAQALLDTFAAGMPSGGIIDHFSSGMILRSRLHALGGAHDKAAQVLDSGIDFFVGRQLSRVRNTLVAERILQLLTSGRLGDIAELAARIDITLENCPSGPTAKATTWDMTTALIWSQIAISAGEYRAAANSLRHWITHCRTRDCERPALTMSLLLARAHSLDGESASASKLIKALLVSAREMGLVRTLIDEGPWLHGILQELFEDPMALPGSLREYVRLLLDLFPDARRVAGSKPHNLIVVPLSRREIEILDLVGKGLKGGFIAAQLGLTAGTVKWYMQQIFDKLDVRTRSAAVLRAREIGIIP